MLSKICEQKDGYIYVNTNGANGTFAPCGNPAYLYNTHQRNSTAGDGFVPFILGHATAYKKWRHGISASIRCKFTIKVLARTMFLFSISANDCAERCFCVKYNRPIEMPQAECFVRGKAIKNP